MDHLSARIVRHSWVSSAGLRGALPVPLFWQFGLSFRLRHQSPSSAMLWTARCVQSCETHEGAWRIGSKAEDTSFLASAVDKGWVVSFAHRPSYLRVKNPKHLLSTLVRPRRQGDVRRNLRTTRRIVCMLRVKLLTAAEPRGVHGLQWTLLVPATVCCGQ